VDKGGFYHAAICPLLQVPDKDLLVAISGQQIDLAFLASKEKNRTQ
jgi:hypothetical protein